MKTGQNKTEISIPRVMIAATSSGAGKTVLTAGVIRALIDDGIGVSAYKCGPDYIDPMFLNKASGRPVINLDSYFSSEDELSALIEGGSSVAVIEGVMGIYDGVSFDSCKGSCYEIAKINRTPVILLVDAKGAGRTVISVIKGILEDDGEDLIKGIILGRMSAMVYARMLPVIEKMISSLHKDVQVIGHIPNDPALAVKSRHLGLVSPDETDDIEKVLNTSAALIKEFCDIEKIKGIAYSAESFMVKQNGDTANTVAFIPKRRLHLALSDDEAFSFMYRENIRIFEDAGIVIDRFSPIRDTRVPEAASAIILCGGYPELFAKELSQNRSMLESVKQLLDSGIPALAECGGFMYLHKTIEDRDKNEFDMAGFIDAKCTYAGHPVNFGYSQIKELNIPAQSAFLANLPGMKGHEFHYWESSLPGSDVLIEKASSKKQYQDLHAAKGRLLGFMHLYYPSAPAAVAGFIAQMEDYEKRKN